MADPPVIVVDDADAPLDDLDAALADGPAIVDLAEVQFDEFDGLSGLVDALDQRKEHGAQLVVVAPDSRMRALFNVEGLHRELWIFETRADALASFRVG